MQAPYQDTLPADIKLLGCYATPPPAELSTNKPDNTDALLAKIDARLSRGKATPVAAKSPEPKPEPKPEPIVIRQAHF
jgi:hypothetical protein